MAEGLITPEGKPVDVQAGEQDFHAAMAAPPTDQEFPAPPKRDPDAPKAERKPRGTRTKAEAPRTGKPASSSKAESAEAADKRRTEGVAGLVQLASAATLVAHQRTGSKAFLADTLTLANSADALASACAETAKASPQFAKALDKITNVGPYAALVTVGIGIAAQLAANHGVGIGLALGAKPVDEVLAELETEPQAA